MGNLTAVKTRDFKVPTVFTIYGKNGTGKSTLVSTFPKPILYFDIKENGCWFIDDDDTYVVKIKSIADMMKVSKAIETGTIGKFVGMDQEPNTIVFDTWSKFRDLYTSKVKSDGKKMLFDEWADLLWKCQVTFDRCNESSYPYTIVHMFQEKTFEQEVSDDKGNVRPEMVIVERGLDTIPSVRSYFRSSSQYVMKTVITKKGTHALKIVAEENEDIKFRKPLGKEIKNILNPTYEKIKEMM